MTAMSMTFTDKEIDALRKVYSQWVDEVFMKDYTDLAGTHSLRTIASTAITKIAARREPLVEPDPTEPTRETDGVEMKVEDMYQDLSWHVTIDGVYYVRWGPGNWCRYYDDSLEQEKELEAAFKEAWDERHSGRD